MSMNNITIKDGVKIGCGIMLAPFLVIIGIILMFGMCVSSHP